ncbi:MAG: hypothetical protein RL748_1028 [Pseudomonadota bacterium]|jgi:acetyl-CoA C-acetyltransferase
MNAFIIDAIRSPRAHGNQKSAFKSLTPITLGAHMLEQLASRNQLNRARVEDVIVGCATQYGGQGSNFARLITLAAGWPDTVAALSINRACCSGLSAVSLAALQVQAGAGVCVAGGVEMMSQVPLAADQGSLFFDSAFNQQHGILPLGLAADAIASRYGISRAACDALAARSQSRALAAQIAGKFTSMLPVLGQDGDVLLDKEQNLRPGNTEAYLSTLPPAFVEQARQYWQSDESENSVEPGESGRTRRYQIDQLQHVHHVGNSPTAADAAAWVLLASTEAIQQQHWTPRARIVASVDCGADPGLALTGVIDATRKVLARAGLTLADIDVFEINEAFAAAMLHWLASLQVDAERVNSNGGTLAFGHAMGATGAILLCMALDELEYRQGRYGLIAMSGAAGLASAMVVERCFR